MSNTAYPPMTEAAMEAQLRLFRPLYGATFGAAVKRFFTKYATFAGRASRSEYWWVALFNVLVALVASTLVLVGGGLSMEANSTEMPPGVAAGVLLVTVYGLATFVPQAALTVRRFHDGYFSGWLVLLALVPVVGELIVLILVLMPSHPAGQRFDKLWAWTVV